MKNAVTQKQVVLNHPQFDAWLAGPGLPTRWKLLYGGLLTVSTGQAYRADTPNGEALLAHCRAALSSARAKGREALRSIRKAAPGESIRNVLHLNFEEGNIRHGLLIPKMILTKYISSDSEAGDRGAPVDVTEEQVGKWLDDLTIWLAASTRREIDYRDGEFRPWLAGTQVGPEPVTFRL